MVPLRLPAVLLFLALAVLPAVAAEEASLASGSEVCVEEPPYPTSPGYTGGFCTSFTDDDLCSVEHYWDDPQHGSGSRCYLGNGYVGPLYIGNLVRVTIRA